MLFCTLDLIILLGNFWWQILCTNLWNLVCNELCKTNLLACLHLYMMAAENPTDDKIKSVIACNTWVLKDNIQLRIELAWTFDF